MFNGGLKHRSGRVIALGRFVLAMIFLFAIWIDSSQPAHSATATYGLLGAYVMAAGLLAAFTWTDWWWDARLAGAAHILDVLVFSLLMFSTDGYTSPFFLFFVFIMLSSAIRWGWRETAVTGIVLIVMYLTAGALAGQGNEQFEHQRFFLRGTHLIILSAILIWFGVNQGAPRWVLEGRLLADLSPDESPLSSALTAALQPTNAQAGILIWKAAGADDRVTIVFSTRRGRPKSRSIAWSRPDAYLPKSPFLFDLGRDRGLAGGRDRPFRFFKASSVLDVPALTRFSRTSGLAVPFSPENGSGVLLLSGIDGLSTDYIGLGEQLAPAVELHIQRHALLLAVQQSALAAARLSLSRDLHDSIVQFLAGACFHVEALARSARSGGDVTDELATLKQMLLEEQQELRSAIGAMRKDDVALTDLVNDLRSLCGRLARQWNVTCHFQAQVSGSTAPMSLHRDTHQLIREAVANAVRHARPSTVQVSVREESSRLQLDIVNDGGPTEPLAPGAPWSLRERVDEANGNLMLTTREGSTVVSISLPLKRVPDQ